MAIGMTATQPIQSRVPLIAQIAGAVLALAVLAFAPPDRGRLLVIAWPGSVTPALLPRLIGAHARLIARGPLSGSYVVEGSVARLRQAIGSALIVAAPRSGCGTVGIVV